MLTLGSLFDGIGGWQIAAVKNGVKPIWSSEIEPFPLAVTKLWFPDTVQLGDITKIDGAKIQPVDIICMGSPCQDLSIAGKREGLDGERSGLFRDAIRIVRSMRNATGGIHPRFVIWENVPGAFSSNGGMDFRAVLEEYTETGIPMPKSGRWATAGLVRSRRCDVAWRCLDAQYWGVPQRRNRIFLVVDFAETGRCAAEILFKSEGVCGNPTSGEGTRQGFTGTAKEGVAGTGDSGGMETQGAVKTDKKSTTPDEEIPPIVLKIRQPKVEGRGGAGAMWQENQSYTLATHQDQTLFQPNSPVDVLNDQGRGGTERIEGQDRDVTSRNPRPCTDYSGRIQRESRNESQRDRLRKGEVTDIVSRTGTTRSNVLREPCTGCTGAAGGCCADFISKSGNGREQSTDSDGEYP